MHAPKHYYARVGGMYQPLLAMSEKEAQQAARRLTGRRHGVVYELKAHDTRIHWVKTY
jgi:hypothetical protein